MGIIHSDYNSWLIIKNKMHFKHYIIVTLSALLFGCIGINPDDTKTTNTPTTPAPATTTATPPKTATPGAIGTEPAIYKIRTVSNNQLQLYYQGYAKNNVSLDIRDQDATESHLQDILKALPKWSADTTKWTDQFDTPSGTPPDAANIDIINDKGGSVIAADLKHTVQNLNMDPETGLFIPATKSVLATKVSMAEKSWIDIRGIMGSARFDMNTGSILDLTNGYGLLLDSKLKEVAYDAEIDPTGVLTLKPDGEMRIDKGTITLHKADIQGTLGVNDATFNFQTRRDNNTANIVFLQTKGKIYSLDSETFPDVMMKVNGPFQFKAGSEIEILLNKDTASKIVLNFPFSFTGDSDKPVIEGKLRFIPKGVEELTNTTGNGILVINSDIGFPGNMDLSQLLADNTILKKKLTLDRASISDTRYTQRQGIYLKISNDSSSLALKATAQIQTAISSLKQAELKADLWNTPLAQIRIGRIGSLATTELVTTRSTMSINETSATSSLFGLKHNIDLNMGNLVITQTFNRAQVSDGAYRFIPQAHNPFWMMQHSFKYNTPFKLGNITITPSAGISHLMIPDTLFQDGFQTLNPEMSLKFGITHTIDSSSLSINILTNAQYQTFNKQPRCDIDTGLNLSFKTSCLSISTNLINPFQSGAEMHVNLQIDF
jgi:hypothetical protein